MTRLSNALQESYVAQGLALGVLAAEVDWLPAGKLDFEFALSRAWSDFTGASHFPRVGSKVAADPYYAILYRSNRRRGPLLAAWEVDGAGLLPYVCNDGWDVAESGEMLGRWTDVSWGLWSRLGVDLVRWYRERDKL
ncbi:hypothetical protein J2X46_001761 [Nocardioides sp. BE266]|uniref:hypothetical protein n=1 Tax=Nocardioides sp. BE266 TaxID=2817725 RepID=UPI002866700D|nr:hypothetical protein [Nocardioides sp. BE266]MDR7252776.1 hypothetical protein [Nocardioides sp. BE266]